jgi:hypothetical protein
MHPSVRLSVKPSAGYPWWVTWWQAAARVEEEACARCAAGGVEEESSQEPWGWQQPILGVGQKSKHKSRLQQHAADDPRPMGCASSSPVQPVVEAPSPSGWTLVSDCLAVRKSRGVWVRGRVIATVDSEMHGSLL